MNSLSDLLTKAAAFDEENYQTLQEMFDGGSERCHGAHDENARLTPLLNAYRAVAVAADKHIDKCPEASRGLLYGDLLGTLASLRKVCGDES